MRKWLMLGLVACGVGLAAVLSGGASRAEGPDLRPIEIVRRGVLERTVKAVGTVEAARVEILAAPETGILQKLRDESQPSVRRGETLFVVCAADLDQDAERRCLDLRRLEGPVREGRRAALAQARLRAERAEEAERTWRALEATRAVSRLERDTKTQALQTARLDVDIARLELETAEADVTRLRAEWDGLERRQGSCTVGAPFDGTIARRLVGRVGESVQRGTPVFELADLSHRRVRMRVPELDSPRVILGQEVRLRFDADPPIEEIGKITWIGAVAYEADERRFVDVLVTLEGPKGALRPGYQVDAEIVVTRADAALVVPLSVLRFQGGSALVEVREGEQWTIRAVETALRNLDEIEIRAGLNEGDQVRLPADPPGRA